MPDKEKPESPTQVKFEDLPVEVKRSRQAGKALQLELARLHETGLAAKNATPAIVDFAKTTDYIQHASGVWKDIGASPISPEGFQLNKQQIYRRMRRAREAYNKKINLSTAEKNIRYKKPLDEWDAQELARGRPRDARGGFSGPKPAWVSAEVHEEAMDRFKSIVRSGMRVAAVDAVELVQSLLNDDSTDNRGRPLVSAGTKLQAATFLIEHMVGKPTQRIESDVSVKLQGILATVMMNPTDMASGNYLPGHLPGITMELAALAVDEGDDDDDYINGELEP